MNPSPRKASQAARTLRQKIEYWAVPQGVKNLAKKAYYLRKKTAGAEVAGTRASALKLRAQNVQFLGCHEGQRCFILATGPSVNTQDLSVLADEVCIGVSFFYLHPQIQIIKPRYHVFAPNHPPFDFDLPRRYLTGVSSAYSHEVEIFYGYNPYNYSCLDYIQAHPKICRHPVRILDFSSNLRLSEDNFQDDNLWNISKSPFVMRTVIYGAIQLASYMGFKQIVLIGCDHDYLSDVKRRENHFYKEQSGNPQDAKHLAEFTTERWFEEYFCRWRDYRLMQTRLSGRGVKIINATNGGLLDVFERKSLSEILSESPRKPCSR